MTDKIGPKTNGCLIVPETYLTINSGRGWMSALKTDNF